MNQREEESSENIKSIEDLVNHPKVIKLMRDKLGTDKNKIYVLKMSGTNLYKIGVTNDILQRVKDLQVGNPIELEIMKVRDGAYDKEKELHDIFKDKHVRGEWFKLTESDLEELSKNL